MESTYVMGLALGGPADCTGLAIVEGTGTSDQIPGRASSLVRYLHAFPPGTNYMDMIDQIDAMREKVKLSCLVVDQTAVGERIVKMFSDELSIPISPVIVGTQHSVHSSANADYVPRQTLVGELIVGLEMGTFKLSKKLPLAPELAKELQNYQNRPTSAASLNGDTWRENPADHLVFATGLACWKLQRNQNSFEYWVP
jgi:hypothetical protein